MYGMPTNLSLKLIDRTYDQKIDMIKENGMHKREVEYFSENISKVNSVDDLMEDFRLYSFAMKAYSLDEQIPHRALVKKILQSNLDDPDSLANRVVDTKMKDFAKGMGFFNDGQANLNTVSPSWKEDMVDRYLQVQLETNEGKSNPAVEEAMYFERKAPDITNWYQVLSDEKLSKVFRTAFNMPDAIMGVDIDRQVELFQDKFDIEDFQNEEKVDELINRFAVFSDIKYGTHMNGNLSGPGSSAVSLLSSPPSFGMNAQIISLDPVTVQNFSKVMRY